MLYRITHRKGPALAPVVVEKARVDAACLAGARAVYAAADAQSLRDRPVAHAAVRDAKAFGGRGCLTNIRVGYHTITIEDVTLTHGRGHPW